MEGYFQNEFLHSESQRREAFTTWVRRYSELDLGIAKLILSGNCLQIDRMEEELFAGRSFLEDGGKKDLNDVSY